MTSYNFEAVGNPENVARFPVEQLDNQLTNAINAIEADLALMPSNPDQKHDSLYNFGTPSEKMRADNDDMNPMLMAAVDATLGGVGSAMGMSAGAVQAVNTMSNMAEGISTFTSANRNSRRPTPTFKKAQKKPAPTASNVMKPSTKSRGGKIKQKSAADLMKERRLEVERAEFKRTAGKRRAMEKRANEAYQMKATLQKYKKQGIRFVDVDMDGNKIAPVAGKPVMFHAPKTPAMAMQAPRPTPFGL